MKEQIRERLHKSTFIYMLLISLTFTIGIILVLFKEQLGSYLILCEVICLIILIVEIISIILNIRINSIIYKKNGRIYKIIGILKLICLDFMLCFKLIELGSHPSKWRIRDEIIPEQYRNIDEEKFYCAREKYEREFGNSTSKLNVQYYKKIVYCPKGSYIAFGIFCVLSSIGFMSIPMPYNLVPVIFIIIVVRLFLSKKSMKVNCMAENSKLVVKGMDIAVVRNIMRNCSIEKEGSTKDGEYIIHYKEEYRKFSKDYEERVYFFQDNILVKIGEAYRRTK